MRESTAAHLPVAAPHAVPSQPVLGSLGEFDPRSDSIISSYLERMQIYFEVNSIKEDRKVAVLLTVVGVKTYETLQNLLLPACPRDNSYNKLLEVLKRHYDPQPLAIGERFRFYQQLQKPGEMIANFLADLRPLRIRCNFDDFLDQALCDRFVCGVQNEALQKKLLTEGDLSEPRRYH